jgi:hypothetical protein
MILNAGNGKFIGGLLFMASLMYGFLIYIILSGFYSNRPVLTTGPVNTSIDRFFANPVCITQKEAEVIKF